MINLFTDLTDFSLSLSVAQMKGAHEKRLKKVRRFYLDFTDSPENVRLDDVSIYMD